MSPAREPDTLDELWRADPFSQLYNRDGLGDVILTADTDWAPDFAIEEIIDRVGEHGHKISIFATHPSETLASVPDFVEVGIHPDLTMRHNQLPFEEVFSRLKGWYPEAVGMRSHRDFFGNNVGDLAIENGLIYDVSVLQWNLPLCQAHLDYNGMARFPYFWEDGIHLDMKFPLDWDEIRLDAPGLKVLNVHPILIYLNCESDDDRRRVVRKHKDLTQVERGDLDPFVRRERGIGDVWSDLLEMLAARGVRTHKLGDVARDGIARSTAVAS